MTTLLIPAADLQHVQAWAAEHVPALAALKGVKLTVNALDVTVETPQFGDVVVRVQVQPSNG